MVMALLPEENRGDKMKLDLLHRNKNKSTWYWVHKMIHNMSLGGLEDTRHQVVVAETKYIIRGWNQINHSDEILQDIQHTLDRDNQVNKTYMLPHHFSMKPGTGKNAVDHPKVAQWVQ